MIFVLIGILGFQSSAQMPLLSNVPYDWGALEHHYPKDAEKCDELCEVSSSLQGRNLTIYLTWYDDWIDARKITPDLRRWKDPLGKARDRDLMYFYDGLGIRIYSGEMFYEGWIMPLNTEEWDVQWENAGSLKTRSSHKVEVLELTPEEKGVVKILIPLDQLNWEFGQTKILKITLIAADSDVFETTDVRTRIMQYEGYWCASTMEFKLKG